jgi:hypothetical protein
VAWDVEFHYVAHHAAQAGFLEPVLLGVAFFHEFSCFGQQLHGAFVAHFLASFVWVTVARQLLYQAVSFCA